MQRARSAVVTAGIAAIVLILAASAGAATPQFPPLTGRVVDDANILNGQTRDELTAMLARHEQVTGEQMVVVTLPSLQGYPIEEFGYQLGRYWGIGQKGKNTGVLLIVAPKERKVRIEVGYGLEGQLTDAQSRIIIENQILPSFKQGDYDAGVLAGTSAILTALGGSPEAGNPPQRQPAQPLLDSPWVIPLLFGGWMLFLVLRRAFVTPYGARGMRRVRNPIFIPGPFPPSGGFPRGGGGFGGGFSGGGGSFGGGGASGGW
jgi:uncharacterized protein